MSASERLRELDARFRNVDSSLSSTRRRQRRLTATAPVMDVLPLIADVVEAAEALAFADEPMSACDCVECRLVRALDALRDALEEK